MPFSCVLFEMLSGKRPFKRDTSIARMAALKLDEGERGAICLAHEIKANVILTDDRKGRVEAVRCGLRVTDTIGLLDGGLRHQRVEVEARVWVWLNQILLQIINRP